MIRYTGTNRSRGNRESGSLGKIPGFRPLPIRENQLAIEELFDHPAVQELDARLLELGHEPLSQQAQSFDIERFLNDNGFGGSGSVRVIPYSGGGQLTACNVDGEEHISARILNRNEITSLEPGMPDHRTEILNGNEKHELLNQALQDPTLMNLEDEIAQAGHAIDPHATAVTFNPDQGMGTITIAIKFNHLVESRYSNSKPRTQYIAAFNYELNAFGAPRVNEFREQVEEPDGGGSSSQWGTSGGGGSSSNWSSGGGGSTGWGSSEGGGGSTQWGSPSGGTSNQQPDDSFLDAIIDFFDCVGDCGGQAVADGLPVPAIISSMCPFCQPCFTIPAPPFIKVPQCIPCVACLIGTIGLSAYCAWECLVGSRSGGGQGAQLTPESGLA